MWNVGNGWTTSPTLTYSNSITLTPSSYPPTEVKVYPILNGTEYLPQLSKSIGLNSFKPNISFFGNEIFCSTEAYTVNLSGVPSNVTTNWSISANNTANIVSSTNTSVTINVYSNTGEFDLTANVVNSCGQSKTVSKSFWVGEPTLRSRHNPFIDPTKPNPNILCQASTYEPGNIIPITVNGQASFNFQHQSGNFDWSVVGNQIYVIPYQTGSLSFTLQAENQCGVSDNLYFFFQVVNCSAPLNENLFKVYPNPSNDVVYIDSVDNEYQSMAATMTESSITGELYDLMGNLKSTVQIINNQASFSAQGLNTGIYALRIDINGTIESHTVVVN